jgi:hypothetical protein
LLLPHFPQQDLIHPLLELLMFQSHLLFKPHLLTLLQEQLDPFVVTELFKLVNLATLVILLLPEPDAALTFAHSSPLDQFAVPTDLDLAEPELDAGQDEPHSDVFKEKLRPMVLDAVVSSPARLAKLEDAPSKNSILNDFIFSLLLYF